MRTTLLLSLSTLLLFAGCNDAGVEFATPATLVGEADQCERGEVAALLRREGIYASQLTWYGRFRVNSS